MILIAEGIGPAPLDMLVMIATALADPYGNVHV